jgi:hypothetical protein
MGSSMRAEKKERDSSREGSRKGEGKLGRAGPR